MVKRGRAGNALVGALVKHTGEITFCAHGPIGVEAGIEGGG